MWLKQFIQWLVLDYMRHLLVFGITTSNSSSNLCRLVVDWFCFIDLHDLLLQYYCIYIIKPHPKRSNVKNTIHTNPYGSNLLYIYWFRRSGDTAMVKGFVSPWTQSTYIAPGDILRHSVIITHQPETTFLYVINLPHQKDFQKSYFSFRPKVQGFTSFKDWKSYSLLSLIWSLRSSYTSKCQIKQTGRLYLHLSSSIQPTDNTNSPKYPADLFQCLQKFSPSTRWPTFSAKACVRR